MTRKESRDSQLELGPQIRLVSTLAYGWRTINIEQLYGECNHRRDTRFTESVVWESRTITVGSRVLSLVGH